MRFVLWDVFGIVETTTTRTLRQLAPLSKAEPQLINARRSVCVIVRLIFYDTDGSADLDGPPPKAVGGLLREAVEQLAKYVECCTAMNVVLATIQGDFLEF